MNIFKLILISITLLFSALTTVHAEYQKNAQDRGVADKFNAAVIYFSAAVTIKTGIDLVRAIDDVHKNHKNIKNIYLYIDSYGGDMDSGKMAYWAVKNSTVPVTTINLATVMSSATMIYCGGKNRLTMPGANFVMHAPFGFGDEAGAKFHIRPNVVDEFQRDVDRYVGMFYDVYKECTKYSDEELKTILYIEDKKLILTPEEAIEKGITKAITQKIENSVVYYYITD